MARGMRGTWISFLLAGFEFEALLFGATLAAGQVPASFLDMQHVVLPAAYLVASASAGVVFLVELRRNARVAGSAWTEPVDLETLRQRVMAEVRPDAKPQEKPTRTRQLLDTVRSRDESPGPTGVAGGSRRR